MASTPSDKSTPESASAGAPAPGPHPRRPVLTLVGDERSGQAADANAVIVGEPSPHNSASKILSKERLLALRERARHQGRRIVQCHGCFDIVHPGHLRHLRHARAQGDLLLVTITGDALINKGTGRPLIPQELRAENLAALDCVDWVYVEARPTAAELLEEVRPDIYVKGKEYETNDDPRFAAEKDAVLRHGGKVIFSSGDVVFSSTALIAALEQSADPYHARLRELMSRAELSPSELSSLMLRFRGQRVVVVGETIRDTYVLCDRPEVAGESPVMTLRPVERRAYDGGAAIIARHLAALGASPLLVTLLPRTDEADALRQRLLSEGVEVRAVYTDTALPEKQRFLVGAQKVMKVDLLERYELDEAKQRELVNVALDAAEGWRAGGGGGTARSGLGCDAAIIADFGLGMWSPMLLHRLVPSLRKLAGVLSGDVSGRRSNLRHLRDMDVLCPSENELRDALGLYDQGLGLVAWRLLSETRTKSAIVTMGPEGLIAFDRLSGAGASAGASAGAGTSASTATPSSGAPSSADRAWQTRIKAEHVPALTSHAVDPLGCGDAMLATVTLALAAAGGGNTNPSNSSALLAAGFLGAAAASVQVQRLGNTVISASDLRQTVARLHGAHLAYAPEVIQTRPNASASVRVAAGSGIPAHAAIGG